MKQIQLSRNVVDDISFGAIVKIRDQLLEMQRAGKKVYRLESGDPSFPIPEHVRLAIEDALKKNRTHYTDSTGIPELRKAIAEKLVKKNGIRSATPENVLVSNGGMNALYITFRSLIAPGEKVIIPDPMWTEIAEIIKLADGIPIRIPVERYVEEMRKYENDDRVRAVFINSPHNPTGYVFGEKQISDIIDFAESKGIFIVSDEAYEDVIFDGLKHLSPGSLYDDTISLFSMSKSYAMSGLRIGYAHTSNEILYDRMKKLLRCTINGVNSATQYGAVAALTGPQDYIGEMRKEYQKRRDIIYEAVSESRYLEPIKPHGTFYLWNRIKEYPPGVSDSWGMTSYLLEKTGVGSSPGPVFGPAGEGYIRFAFSAATDHIQEAADVLRNF
ncbi:aspartate transaminase related protein [Thermoplasma acidophilum]|uniref:Aminotransferase n=1 Tax=Thermoplasma acidophilum (strain ATCC 25905 / DSM 1728 / JCM 9062 / NBRC 15155 / AMRC-C165) TaxID=273075 RepID=Q9HK41_THEAC|nr:pyridoxal phosphate-dependent aminotransferase [Thermoplasma acidophilum]CAC11898.1 aspartate transaminase related protein [Thermoplasma acidophilum]